MKQALTIFALLLATVAGAQSFENRVLAVPGIGGVPTSRTLTINGATYDLSADRSWSIATGSGAPDSGIYATVSRLRDSLAAARAVIAASSTNDRARANHTGTQDTSTITNLTAGLNIIRGLFSGKANVAHTHDSTDVNNWTNALNVIRGLINGKAATSHTHAATDLTSGTLPPGRIAGTQTDGKVVKLVSGVLTYADDLNSGGGGGSVDTTAQSYSVATWSQVDTAKLAMRDEYMKLSLGRSFTTVGCLHANSGTTLQIGGTGLIGVVSGVGTAANSTGSNKNTSAQRTSYSSYQYTTTAAADQTAGILPSFLGALLSEGGYYMSAVVAWNSLPSGYRMAIGFRGGSSFLSSDPSAWASTAMCMFGKDATDSDIKIMTRATGTGSSTKTSTGFSPTTGNIYEFVVDVPAGAASASFRIYERTSTTSRSLVYSSTVTTAIPTSGQYLSPQVTTNTGTSTTALVMNFYKLLVTAEL